VSAGARCAVRGLKNPVQATAASIEEGERLYRSECLVCHGETGDGNGPWRDKLPTAPGDLTDKKTMARMTDGEIFWKISTGRVAMPSFAARFEEEERWHLVNYVRTFAGG
jgi:mono/diheme cytochrome c family protein